MSKSMSLDSKIEAADSVISAEYNPSSNTLTVTADGFSNEEVEAIRDGKLTPIRADGETTTYDVHITNEEQRQERASKFSFSE